jgi:hypothetical protein
MIKTFYLIAAIVGTIVPWLFFANFFTTQGIDIPLFVRSLFVNGAAGGSAPMSSFRFSSFGSGRTATRASTTSAVGGWYSPPRSPSAYP